MKTWVRKTLGVGILAAGALLLAPGAANADTGQVTGGTGGVIPVEAPVNVAGNSLGLLGVANATGAGVNNVTEGGRRGGRGHVSRGHFGLNGLQLVGPISVPINICGNALGILGAAQSNAACVNERGLRRGRDFGGHWDGGHGHLRPAYFRGGDDFDDDLGDFDDVDFVDDDFIDDQDDFEPRGGVMNDGYGTDVLDDVDDVDAIDDVDPIDVDVKPATKGDGYTKPATKPAKTKPAKTKPATTKGDGYTKPAVKGDGYTKPIATGSKTKSKGGRAGATESVSGTR